MNLSHPQALIVAMGAHLPIRRLGLVRIMKALRRLARLWRTFARFERLDTPRFQDDANRTTGFRHDVRQQHW